MRKIREKGTEEEERNDNEKQLWTVLAIIKHSRRDHKERFFCLTDREERERERKKEIIT